MEFGMALVLSDAAHSSLMDVVRPFLGIAVKCHLNVLVHEWVRWHWLPIHNQVLEIELYVLAGSHGTNGAQAVGTIRRQFYRDLGHLDHLPSEVMTERLGQHFISREASVLMLLDLVDERGQLFG